MSDPPHGSQRDEEEDVDPGEPIMSLAGLEYDVSGGLLGRIRRAIGRRATTAQVTSFAFDLPGVVFKEFWTMMVELLGHSNGKDGGNGRKAS